MKNRVIIAGSRSVPERDKILANQIKEILSQIGDNTDIEIVSGRARGADMLGESVAVHNNYIIKRFPADWNKYGKSAGYIRNKQMAEYSTHLIAIWDGASRGTKSMIDLAKKENLKVYIVEYEF